MWIDEWIVLFFLLLSFLARNDGFYIGCVVLDNLRKFFHVSLLLNSKSIQNFFTQMYFNMLIVHYNSKGRLFSNLDLLLVE